MVQYLPGNEKRFIQRAVGIEMTIVNSQVLLEKKIHGALPGKVLGDGNESVRQGAA